MKKSRWLGLVLLLLLTAVMVAACGGNRNENPDNTAVEGTETPKANTEKPAEKTESPKEEPTEPVKTVLDPVELTVYSNGMGWDEARFTEVVGDYLLKQQPNVKFKFLENKATPVENLAVSGIQVDLFFGPMGPYLNLIDAGYADFDLSELIKKHNFDLSRLDPVLVETMKKYNNGTLNALPYSTISHVLTYNKDIFDRFNVPYPTDDMTWDEVYDVAKQLTQENGGVQYIGFGLQQPALFEFNQYGQDLVNKETGKSMLTEGKWPQIINTFAQFYSVPGNEYLGGGAVNKAFNEEQRMAMMVNYNSQFAGTFFSDDLNYDVVRLPSFSDNKGVGSGAQPTHVGIASNSEHKDEAFVLIQELLSDDFQLDRARGGNMPSILISGLEDVYFADVPKVQGKNINGLIPNQYAPPTDAVYNGVKMRNYAVEAFQAVATGEMDVNTALRTVSEKADLEIEKSKSTP